MRILVSRNIFHVHLNILICTSRILLQQKRTLNKHIANSTKQKHSPPLSINTGRNFSNMDLHVLYTSAHSPATTRQHGSAMICVDQCAVCGAHIVMDDERGTVIRGALCGTLPLKFRTTSGICFYAT